MKEREERWRETSRDDSWHYVWVATPCARCKGWGREFHEERWALTVKTLGGLLSSAVRFPDISPPLLCSPSRAATCSPPSPLTSRGRGATAGESLSHRVHAPEHIAALEWDHCPCEGEQGITVKAGGNGSECIKHSCTWRVLASHQLGLAKGCSGTILMQRRRGAEARTQPRLVPLAPPLSGGLGCIRGAEGFGILQSSCNIRKLSRCMACWSWRPEMPDKILLWCNLSSDPGSCMQVRQQRHRLRRLRREPLCPGLRLVRNHDLLPETLHARPHLSPNLLQTFGCEAVTCRRWPVAPVYTSRTILSARKGPEENMLRWLLLESIALKTCDPRCLFRPGTGTAPLPMFPTMPTGSPTSKMVAA